MNAATETKTPEFITINNTEYLGFINKKDADTFVVNAVKAELTSEASIRKWYRYNELGDMIELTLSALTAYTVRKLNVKEANYFEVAGSVMANAKVLAPKKIVVDSFNNLIKVNKK